MNKFLTLYTPSHAASTMLGLPAIGETMLVSPFRALANLLVVWQTRLNDRAALAGLSGHLLDDVAVERGDALRESWKPFWRA